MPRKNGVTGGPLLATPAKTVAQIAFVGVQTSVTCSLRLPGFDSGGWSEGVAGLLVCRIADEELALRKGAAISRFDFLPQNVWGELQFRLRLKRGGTAARSDTLATISTWVSS